MMFPRGTLLLVACLACLLGACQNGLVSAAAAVPVDLDRQCTPDKGCLEGLLCVRLFTEEVAADGGLAQAANYTCHPACGGDGDCPQGYRCYRPLPPPMQRVCVRSDVVARLEADGGP